MVRWLGTSISDQATADKAIPHLLACRDLAPVLFLSAEPLLGPVNLHRLQDDGRFATPGIDGLDWVIVGGESGPQARPCEVEWIRQAIQQCHSAVPCFVKQLGAWPLHHGDSGDARAIRNMTHAKGGDPSEWPEDLRVREFPILK